MIFQQKTIKPWFIGINSSIKNDVVQPLQNAEQVLWKYNQAIQHNTLTQDGWDRLLSQSDESLKKYLTNLKGANASASDYAISLQENVAGFKQTSAAISQYNTLSAFGAEEQSAFTDSISSSNSRLGSYLSGLNGSKASMKDYIISLIGATVKTVGLQIATTALNAVLTWGISIAISGIISLLSKWLHSTKDIISASEEAKEKIRSIKRRSVMLNWHRELTN